MRGKEYQGTLSTTASGKTCQHWSLDYPHGHHHNYLPGHHAGLSFPIHTIISRSVCCFAQSGLWFVENYCRNPDTSIIPWCYTTDSDKRWERCQVPLCGGEWVTSLHSQHNKVKFFSMYVQTMCKFCWSFEPCCAVFSRVSWAFVVVCNGKEISRLNARTAPV